MSAEKCSGYNNLSFTQSAEDRVGWPRTWVHPPVPAITGVTALNSTTANGKLGTVVSSERFKDDVKPMDKASEAIHALKPVTFHYKPEIDPPRASRSLASWPR